MIINNKEYKLCLFDTNAISSFLQNPKSWLDFFGKEFSLSNTIICYSAFTLSELYYRKELYEKFIDFFSFYPSALLEGYNSIFEKEIMNYDSGDVINPISILPYAIIDNTRTPKEKLIYVLKNSGFIDRTKYWKEGRQEVLDGMINLKKNYPPKKDKYTINEIDDFNLMASTSQIGIRNIEFAKNILKSGKEIKIEKFKSIKTTSYMTFYKFYPDNRKPELGDVFDIIISSLLPYVDYFITEGNMYEIIKIIKNRHKYLENLIPYKLKDINRELRNKK